MMPDNEKSTVSVVANFEGGRGKPTSGVIDYELGGIAINDPSKGLDYQIWRSRKIQDRILLDNPDISEPIIILDLPNVTEFSFTFDQNMRVTIAYVQKGTSYIKWYDTQAGEMVTTTIGKVKTPRVSLDDKRTIARVDSDVILAYVKNDNKIYYRYQRDRYGVEYKLSDIDASAGLVKIGMMNNYRFGFMIRGA